MTDLSLLRAHIRTIKTVGVSILAVTAVVTLVSAGWWHRILLGLLIGEFGGAYVVYSLLRQGHLDDEMDGAALFAAGVVGMFMRFLVLGLVVYASYKVHGSLVATLVGYVAGFIVIFVGLTNYMRKPAS